MIDNQDDAKKIWMTEIGAPTSAPHAAGVSQVEQAREITDVLWRHRNPDTADRPSYIPSETSTPPILTATRTTSAR
jgi:hypothetical protein